MASYDLFLSDMTGKTLLKESKVELGPADHSISVAHLPAQIYAVELVNRKSGDIHTLLFMKK